MDANNDKEWIILGSSVAFFSLLALIVEDDRS